MITKQFILDKVSEKDIYRQYLQVDAEPNRYYENKIAGSTNKTLKFYLSPSGELLFKDFSPNRQNFKGDVVSSAMVTKNLNYRQALYDVAATNKLIINNIKDVSCVSKMKRDFLYQKPKPIKLDVMTQPFTPYDYNYWSQYYIDLALLEKQNIYSLKAVFKDNKLWISSTPHRPLFGYKCNDQWKIYSPLRNDYKKWGGNWNKNCIGNLENIDYTKPYLIITSSMKDGLVLSTHGYNQISLPSENTFPYKLEYICSKFANVYAFLDFDEAGHTWNNELSKKYQNIIPINYSNKHVKDISDYSKLFGYEQTNELLFHLLKF
jgi:hypothetical protein